MQWTEKLMDCKETCKYRKKPSGSGDHRRQQIQGNCLEEPIYLTIRLIIHEKRGGLLHNSMEKRGSLPRFSDFGNLQAAEASQNCRQS